MDYEYFYHEQAEQFTFYRIPKVLFTNAAFAKLSTEAKVLYGLLLDRVSLSRDNGWLDAQGRVYIIFTLEAIEKAMGCSEKSAIKYLTELETQGLIERIRQGLGKPSLIYVKNFIRPKNLQVLTCNHYSSGPVKTTDQDLENLQGNNTDMNKTDYNDIHLILSEDRMRYESYLREHLDILSIKEEFPYDGAVIEGIVALLLDTLCTKKESIRISGEEKEANIVKAQFMKLNSDHIRYVLECMKSNTNKIRSMKQYLLASLYNAPFTMGSYYRAEANHDMASASIMKGQEKWNF